MTPGDARPSAQVIGEHHGPSADCIQALAAAQRLLGHLQQAVRARLQSGGDDTLWSEQAPLHGYAWAATYVRALEQILNWFLSLRASDRHGEIETLILQAAFGEYLAQLAGGIPMSQGEFFRADTLDIDGSALASFSGDPAVAKLRATGFSSASRRRIADLLARGGSIHRFGDAGFMDPTLAEIRTQFSRYATDLVDAAHRWHLENALIPDAVISEMAGLGVFAMTIPAEFGGLGLGKTAMCVVTEELARAHIGLGSLGTRSEIAGDLISASGTDEQKRHFLPLIAGGQIIPTACFTEADVGSDLGAIKTRATPVAGGWRIDGAKTWITHGARSDLMTLLARTERDLRGYGGLSMFLAEKPRGTDSHPFPAQGMRGSEIEVLGYRGMKEYEIGFDGFFIPADRLLGGEAGLGFKQLMRTFESARIQTAARAVGVAQDAMELGLSYANQRRQFGRPILGFPRVANKLAWMAVETMVARQLTLHAAAEKDAGRRCDIVAGMAKMLAARVAWCNADNALQVHGGNGYALEYRISRVLCDARILNIFEGAAEIQAHIVAKGLLF